MTHSIFDVWSSSKAPLRKYLIDRLKDDDLADEFQQEILLQSFPYLKKDTDPRYREAYLYRVANLLLDNVIKKDYAA